MAKYIIVIVALLIGCWLLLDGARALIAGSYTTPSSGAYAGQLGPWSKIIICVGLNPAGLAVKLVHIVLGSCWLAFGLLVFRGASFAWWPLFLTALLSLWYLPFGTIAGVVVAATLLLPSMRPAV